MTAPTPDAAGMAMGAADRRHAILGVRLECLQRAITARDWAAVEFEFDRVASQAAKIAGTRGRAYDLVPAGQGEVRHASSTERGHTGRCYCGRPARWHVMYGSGCGNVCGEHKRRITRAKNGHVTAVSLRVAEVAGPE